MSRDIDIAISQSERSTNVIRHNHVDTTRSLNGTVCDLIGQNHAERRDLLLEVVHCQLFKVDSFVNCELKF